MTGTCATCSGRVEYVTDTPVPFWRHVDMADLDSPHAARPDQD